jgi:hypothetical protein
MATETSQKLFDWKSLITPAMNLGMQALGDKIAPGADLQSVQNSNANTQANLAENQRQFNIQNQMAQQRMGQSNQIRQTMMPGMYTTLGFSPEQGQKMAADYAARAATPPPAPGGMQMPGNFGAYQPPQQQQGPGLGAKIGGAAINIGTSMIPGLLTKILGGAAPAVAGAVGAGAGAGAGAAAGAAGAGAGAGGGATGGILGGLGATGVGAIAAGAIGAAILAKKLIGQGRKQANKLTGEGGLQYNFNEGLREIVAAQQAGQIDQAQRDDLVRQMYAQLQQDGARFAQGGNNQAKVVDQMLRHYQTNPVTASSLRGF